MRTRSPTRRLARVMSAWAAASSCWRSAMAAASSGSSASRSPAWMRSRSAWMPAAAVVASLAGGVGSGGTAARGRRGRRARLLMTVSMPHPGAGVLRIGGGRQPGVTLEHPPQRSKHPDLLLAGGRNVAAEAAEALPASQGAPAPADLLLQLGHPDVPLGLVVVERHPEVGGKAQHLLAVIVQAGQQVGGLGAAPAAAAAAGRAGGGRWRVGPPALSEDRLVAGAVVVQAPGVQPVGAGGHGPPDAHLASISNAAMPVAQDRWPGSAATPASSRRWWALQRAWVACS